MLRISIRFNLAIHLPLRWIAALITSSGKGRNYPFGGVKPAGS